MEKYHIIKTEEYIRLLEEEINDPTKISEMLKEARANAFELTYNIRRKEYKKIKPSAPAGVTVKA